MDPDAALKATLTLLADHDWQAAKEQFENLQAWVDRGGFPPKDPNWEEKILRAAPSSWREGWR
jgi:hypothetical protein